MIKRSDMISGETNLMKAKRRGAQFIVENGDRSFVVRRDEDGVFRCDCPEFDRKSELGERCIHLLSVRESISNKESEIFDFEGAGSEEHSENVLKFSPSVKSNGSQLKSKRRSVDSKTALLIKNLDRNFSDWSYQIKEFRVVDENLFIRAAVTVGEITREGLGAGNIRELNGVETAEQMALESAAAKFANNASDKTFEAREISVNDKFSDFPKNPLAATFSDMVTSSQLKMIRTISSEAGVEPETECMRILSCAPGELSRKAASKFIEYLQSFALNGSINAEVRLVG
ncbi:MAG: hypothetical protein KIS76_00415 [Pyrinomonadaceae bacterium]|nr:hypothetical protein [Pyrinomonadaceae bacterium]